MQPIARYAFDLYGQLSRAGWHQADLALLHSRYKVGLVISYDLVRANWKPFIVHLIGTASIAAWDSNNPDLIAAALIHSALEFGRFPAGIWTRRHKLDFVAKHASDAIAKIIGDYYEARHQPLLDTQADAAARQPLLVHLRLANALDDILDEQGPVRTAKRIAELRDGAPGLLKLAAIAQQVNAPSLATAFTEAASLSPAEPIAQEPGQGSFSVRRLAGRLAP